MSNIEAARKALVTRILKGAGDASLADRQAAFNDSGLAPPLDALVDKVAKRAYSIIDADISTARQSGLCEDQLFEIVVCAAVGQATRQYENAIAALDSASKPARGQV